MRNSRHASLAYHDTHHKVRSPPLMPIAKYIVKATPWTGERAARGVFAESDIERGELVETAHCILVPQEEYSTHLRQAQHPRLSRGSANNL